MDTNLLIAAIAAAGLISTLLFLARADIRRFASGWRLIIALVWADPSFSVWMAAARLKAIVRSMAAGSTTVFAAVVAVIPLYLQLEVNEDATGAGPLAGILLVALLTAIAVGVWSLRRLPPSDYARILVGGQTASDTITAIAYEMTRLSDQFDSDPHRRRLDEAGEEILRINAGYDLDTHFTERQLKRLHKHTATLAVLMLGQQRQVQQILEMKTIAEQALGIHAQRMCDHIFCFSPTVFDNRVRKFVDNWEDVLRLGSSRTGPQRFWQRLRALLAENERITSQVRRRKRHLMRLINNRDLHVFAHACASGHSATRSLAAYAEALSHVAGQAHRRAKARRFRHEAREHVGGRLRLLLRVQRAHPGFDLHSTCRRACKILLHAAREEFASSGGTRDEKDKKVQAVVALERKEAVLGRLDAYRYVPDSADYGGTTDENRAHAAEDVFDKNEEVAVKELEALSALFDYVTALVEDSRNQVVEAFRHEYKARQARRRDAGAGGTIVVTHGYSKTVREVLQHEFARKEIGPPPRMYMLTGGGDAFDARLMEYELRHDARTRNPLTSGSGQNLRSLLANEEAMIIVLLGAECFDLQRRIVQSDANIADFLVGCRNAKAKTKPWVVAVAESFKMRPNLVLDRLFFHDHLDRTCIYDSSLIDTVVTDAVLARAIEVDRSDIGAGVHDAIHAAEYDRARDALDAVADKDVKDGIMGSRKSGPLPQRSYRRRTGEADAN